MHILIIKHGALGDVVRTSYVAAALRKKFGDALRLSWITAPAAVSLIRFNPHIDDVWTSFEQCKPYRFDHIYSLDDENDVVTAAAALQTARTTGAILLPGGERAYTDDAAEWFDMGLLSRFGKEEADRRKIANSASHAEIFARMFEVGPLTPGFWGLPRLEAWAEAQFAGTTRRIGINPFAGGRWPAKELRQPELEALIGALQQGAHGVGKQGSIVLLGAGEDHQRNLQLAARINDPRIRVPNTDDTILRLAAIIRQLDVLITSDSLAMHLAVAQHIPFVAFFAPTSAAEIDTFDRGTKIQSTAPDYCNYRKDADNSSITAARILAALPHM